MITPDQTHNTRPLVIAHRGASKDLQENTLEAFDLAIKQKADVIECDLRVTIDDQIVIVHDSAIRLTLFSKVIVSRLRFSEIQQKYSYIPSFEKLLYLSKGRVKLALELKDSKFDNVKYIEKLIHALTVNDFTNDVFFISFKKRRLEIVKNMASQFKTGFISLKFLPSLDHYIDIDCALYPALFLNPYYVKTAHQNKKEVWAMDITPTSRVKYYIQKNIDGILTNHPQKTYNSINKFSRYPP